MNVIKLIKQRGYLTGYAVGLFKLVMAAISLSLLIFIHAVYNIIKACAMSYAARAKSEKTSVMFFAGILVIAAGAVYLIYSLYVYLMDSSTVYHMYLAIGIAAVTTYELVVAIHGLIKAKKQRDIKHETAKYINLASALISVSLTQTAMLSFTNGGDVSRFYALGDAIFGFLALLVGVYMLIRSRALKKENNSLQEQKA